MKECRECELAIYCYSESSTWVFRTKDEMAEKLAMIHRCPLHNCVPSPNWHHRMTSEHRLQHHDSPEK